MRNDTERCGRCTNLPYSAHRAAKSPITPIWIRPVFLKVSQSLTGKVWRDRLDPAAARTALAIAQKTDMSDILARVVAGRGVGLDEAEGFLAPAIRDLMPDPSTLTGLDETVERLALAVETGETVALFGDYDVDGASSVALMQRFLSALGVRSSPTSRTASSKATDPIPAPWTS